MNTKITPLVNEVPCMHEDISLLGGSGECEIGCLQDYDCGKDCQEYKPHQILVCKRHHKQYIGECDECFGEYWENEGRKLDRQWRREHWMETHLHFTLKYSPIDYIGCWILNYHPKFGNIYQWDIGGKRYWRGFYITGFRRGIIFRFHYLMPPDIP